MVLLKENLDQEKSEVDFSQADTEIKVFTHNGFIILSNGCRLRAIKAIETLPIKEKFGIDSWAKWLPLKDVLTAEQLEELWLNYKHETDFALSKEDLRMFIF